MGAFRSEVPKPLDVLDADVDAYLSHMCQFERIQRTTGSVEYRVQDEDGSNLFGIVLRKVNNETTGIHIILPPPEAVERAKPILQKLLFQRGILPNPVPTELDPFAYEEKVQTQTQVTESGVGEIDHTKLSRILGGFVDLEIHILQRRDEGYPVQITLGGEQVSSQDYLSADILPWTPGTDLVSDGQRLFDALFADGVLRDAWMKAHGQSAQRRIRLRIDPNAPELHTLPWELLHDGDTMLSADGRTPFSRYLPVFEPWGGVVEERPIRVLVVISNPTDLEDYNLAPLDVEAEQDILRVAFSESNEDEVELTFLTPPVTLKHIEQVLKHNNPHVLHYVGHGTFNERRQQAAIYLQDDQGDTKVVRDKAFIEMLTRQPKQARPRLIFLASCQTATTSTTHAFRGLGPSLVVAGVPAVVAMQNLVAIQTARELSWAFYQCLTEHGAVDCAMNEARSVLLTVDRPDAAVPVLFMRLKSGLLWGNEIEEDLGTGSTILKAKGDHIAQATAGSTAIVGDANVIGDHSTAIKAEGEAVVATQGGIAARQVAVGGDIHGDVDVHIGDKIYNRSELEELWDYMGHAVAAYSAAILSQILHTKLNKPDTPYRSLKYFDLSHSAVFYGREPVTDEFLDQIEPESRRLTLLHAPSGAGKTSFIRAGLEPALWGRKDITLYARAFKDPIADLKQIVVNMGGPGPDLDNLLLHEFLQLFVSSHQAKQRLIVILDQFEEFFIYLPEQTQTSFIDQLSLCLKDEFLPVRFVLSLREDYLAKMEAFKRCIPDVLHNTFPLPPLTREQAAMAITKPAEAFGISWAPDIVDALLNYLVDEGIAPPHLQLICTKLYEHVVKVGDQQITSAHLKELGSLEAIHKAYLVNEMKSLRGPHGSLEKEEIGWQVLKRLVGSEGIKVTCSPDYLQENLEVDDPIILKEIIDTLVQRRVLRRDSTPKGEASIEIAHETLVAEIQARESPQEIRTKAARELIERELVSYRAHSTLMGVDHLRILDEYQDSLPRLSTEMAEFLLRSAAAADHQAEFWFTQAVARAELAPFEILTSLLKDKNPTIRMNTASSLGDINMDESADLLAEVIFDPDAGVRKRVFASLLHLNTPKTREILENTPPELVERYYERVNELVNELLHIQRIQNLLEIQSSRYGIDTPPQITIELETRQDDIEKVKEQLAELGFADIESIDRWRREALETQQSKYRNLRRTLHHLEIQNAKYGLSVPTHIVVQIEDLRHALTQLESEMTKLNNPRTEHFRDIPGKLRELLEIPPAAEIADAQDTSARLPLEWLRLQEKLATFTPSDTPLAYQMQIQDLQQHIQQLATRTNSSIDEVMGKREEFSDEWSASLERQLESWNKLKRGLELKRARYGTDTPPSILMDLEDIQTHIERVELEIDQLALDKHHKDETSVRKDESPGDLVTSQKQQLASLYRRRNLLEEKRARYDLSASPHIVIELDDIIGQIEELEHELDILMGSSNATQNRKSET